MSDPVFFNPFALRTTLTLGGPGADSPMTHITAAMTAGATGTIVTNPLWVIKTRFMVRLHSLCLLAHSPQTQEASAADPRYRHTIDAIRRIYKTEGIRSFYRGLVPSLFGVSHIAVQFPMYEQLKVYYRTSPPCEWPC